MLAWLGADAATTRVVCLAQADSMRGQQVVYNGRVCPLNTVARDFTLKLTGGASWNGMTAEQVLLSWVLYPEEWKEVRMVRVKKSEVQKRLGLKENRARFADFFDAQGNYRLKPGEFPDMDERLMLVALLTRGELFQPLPEHMQPLPESRIWAELMYNAMPWDGCLIALCFALALFSVFVDAFSTRKKLSSLARWMPLVPCSLLLVSLGVRWYVADHVPVSNTYETLQVFSLSALLMACLCRRVAIPALVVAGAALLVAHLGALDPQVTPLVPALQSPWLASHVTVIMVAYCLFALLLFRPDRTMLVWADVLLATGIMLGSIWARTAWGSYWSWDPKETWALISLIVYVVPLVPAVMPWLRNERWLRLYLRLAFLTILMTYFGCNYLLTGMHSYR